MILVVGATGLLGAEVCRQLTASGRRVAGLVRASSDRDKVAALERSGVKLIEGDLKHPESLRRACAQVKQVVATASATLSRADGDDIDSVDHRGNLALIEAAREAGVDHFVFTSFQQVDSQFSLQDAKRAAERALVQSRLGYTILQPPHFLEVWFSGALGFDVAGRRARVFGWGAAPINWVSLFDVARVACTVTGLAAARGRTLEFGGPKELSQRDLIALFEKRTGQAFEVETVPARALRDQLESTDALQSTFAALMLRVCTGKNYNDPTALKGLIDFELMSPELFVERALAAQKN